MRYFCSHTQPFVSRYKMIKSLQVYTQLDLTSPEMLRFHEDATNTVHHWSKSRNLYHFFIHSSFSYDILTAQDLNPGKEYRAKDSFCWSQRTYFTIEVSRY